MPGTESFTLRLVKSPMNSMAAYQYPCVYVPWCVRMQTVCEEKGAEVPWAHEGFFQSCRDGQ